MHISLPNVPIKLQERPKGVLYVVISYLPVQRECCTRYEVVVVVVVVVVASLSCTAVSNFMLTCAIPTA